MIAGCIDQLLQWGRVGLVSGTGDSLQIPLFTGDTFALTTSYQLYLSIFIIAGCIDQLSQWGGVGQVSGTWALCSSLQSQRITTLSLTTATLYQLYFSIFTIAGCIDAQAVAVRRGGAGVGYWRLSVAPSNHWGFFHLIPLQLQHPPMAHPLRQSSNIKLFNQEI
jgi:hypothetical protein